MAVVERSGEELVQSRNRGSSAISGVTVGQYGQTSLSGDVLEEHEGLWTVRDLETGIFGSGHDPQAALVDFEAALHEHLDVLERQPALTAELEAQLRYLRVRLS